LALGKTDNLWEATLGCTPGRSVADQANRSAFPFKATLGCTPGSSNFCPHLIFKFGDLIDFSVLKD